MDLKRFTVIRDTREQFPWNFPEDKLCTGTIDKALKTGDYTIEGAENLLVVERKMSTGEVANNIGVGSKRWKNVLERMLSYKYRFIILEFPIDFIFSFPRESGIPSKFWKRLRISSNFIASSLINYQLNYGINVIFGGNAKNSSKIAYQIFSAVHKGLVDGQEEKHQLGGILQDSPEDS